MRQLELKDIAGYLPYGLKCVLSHDGHRNLDLEYPEERINGLFSISNILVPSCDIEILNNISGYGIGFIQFNEIDVILRPMEDITREIVVESYNEGQPFVPLIELAKFDCSYEGLCYDLIRSGDPDDNGWYIKVTMPNEEDSYWFMLYYNIDILDFLNQWHFDYRGLIEQGLAIDINTLNKIK